MRRLEQFLSRKRSLIESMTNRPGEPIDRNSELQALDDSTRSIVITSSRPCYVIRLSAVVELIKLLIFRFY